MTSKPNITISKQLNKISAEKQHHREWFFFYSFIWTSESKYSLSASELIANVYLICSYQLPAGNKKNGKRLK